MKTNLVTKIMALLLCLTLIFTIPMGVFAEEIVNPDEWGDIINPDDPEWEEGQGGEDEPVDIYANAVDVATAEELEMALEEQNTAIRITADFVIDRTFYITKDVAIFTEEAHTLTRDAAFGGDIFVVGEGYDGTICTEPVRLTVGHSESTEKDLLIIDGNRDNMTVDVTGSALFIVTGSCADLYENITMRNHKKVGNEKTLTEVYGVSYVGRIGGAVAIITLNASMNIYGGKYINNAVNEIIDDTEEGQVSTQGGVIYDFGTLSVYGGEFSGNYAGRGGVFYCYRTINLYNANIFNNTASSMGGAVYMPNSTAAYLYIGGENEYGESRVVFRNNTAASYGGAIYARNVLDVQNAEFIENSSTGSSGGAIAAWQMVLTISNTMFDTNIAKSYGSAIYYSGENGKNSDELTILSTEFKNNSVNATGGAIYMNSEAVAVMEDVEFSNNYAKNYGGAIYLNNAHIDINGGVFNKNSNGQTGGAISGASGASIKLNNITASENTSGTSGGFAYCGEDVSLTMYDSSLSNNTAGASGGAISYDIGSFGGVYNSTFTENHAAGQGGALNVYTNGYNLKTKVVVHSCTFTSNHADGYGGALYASKASVIDLYNTTAKYNSATKGGFLYHTTTNTTVNLSALVIQGNTATDGGPIIWGNLSAAVLNIDKGMIVDLDHEGDMDDAYWATFIVNLLKVKEVVLEVPNYIGYTGAVIVPELPKIPVKINNAESLEKAILDGKTLIIITGDFELDRTYYIYRNTIIYAPEQHTLTRASGFGGDLFVVGEYSDGTICEHDVTLTLGDAESTVKDQLIIDGNRDNMTIDVKGSALFIVGGANVDIYENVTMRNHKKVGNEKTLTEAYGVSYVGRVGGAVAIVAASSSMNIYGGKFINNAVNELVDDDTEEGQVSSQGGVIYDFGKLNIYGGVFENNYGGRGGVLYCYRTINIYKAEFNNNSASNLGGVVYMPASTAANLYIGAYTPLVESNVIFKNNTSGSNGGVVYAQNKMTVQNATFEGNSAANGGVIASNKAVINISDSTFTNNTTTSHGAAIYSTLHNTRDEETDLTISGTTFTSNTAKGRAGAIYLTSGAVAQIHLSEFTENSSALGGAFYLVGAEMAITYSTISDNETTGTGGAISAHTNTSYPSTTIILSRVTGERNIAGTSGGFAYCASGASLSMYSNTLNNNTSGASGGAVSYDEGSYGAIYKSTFTENHADGQGGAVNVYTNGYNNNNKVIIHSCDFTSNSAGGFGGVIYASKASVIDAYNITATQNSASKGGFMYHTTTNTMVTLVGVTLSGNTATDGGPIIWGNLTAAHLYLDKSKWDDLDHTGSYNNTYWKAAIYNKLTVHNITEDIPKWLDYLEESYDHMSDAVDVATPNQLEEAINSGAPHIRIIADIIIDRTYYITGKTTIFTTLSRKLTRAPGFGGDIFVVGENAEGKSALQLGGNAKLTLGNPLSTKENLLVIDGNKENMTEAVKGSVVFVCYGSSVDLHTNVTVQNTYKSDNERAYKEIYKLSRPNRIGGVLAVVVSGTLNIYGGTYKDNMINEEDTSSEETRNCTIGGLIYNYNNLNIYGGLFENNQGARGGVIYSYRSVRIEGGSFIGNIATVSGGVLYAPNSAPVHTYIGTKTEDGAEVLFQNNSAMGDYGGALYISPLCSLVIYGNTTFDGNTATKSGGAICSYGQLTAKNTTFKNNIANSYGGAVYAANSNSEYVTRYQEFVGCTFKNNNATSGGALALYSSNSDFPNGAIGVVTDCTFTSNTAASPTSQTANSYGGAIYVERKSNLTLKDSAFSKNSARTEGGAVYAGGCSIISVKDTSFKQNSILEKGKHGGAIAIHSVKLDLDGATFTSNTSQINGGALYISYSSKFDQNSEVDLKDCTFTSNSAASLGGAVYTTKQTVINEKRILTVRNSEFKTNKAVEGGGAMYFVSGTETYMADVIFTKNSSEEGNGGAISTSGGIIEMDTITFTENNVMASGGALYFTNGANIIMNAVTATGNYSDLSGGFLASEDSTVNIYNSIISDNESLSNNAGGVMFNQGTTANVYNTTFTNNIAKGSGGAIFVYTNGTPVVVQDCTMTGNQGGSGGAIYASKASVLYLYNITATNNSATKGGFMYQTTTDTHVTIAGLTVSGNTATSGGPIIWGNLSAAILDIDKSQYKDNDVSGALDDAYWKAAIVNKLTVNEVSVKIPSYDDYVSKKDDGTDTPSTKTPVSVQPVFDLAQNSSNADINTTYAKFPRLDNSSNFMSKNVTTFDNINGGTVTVDTFIYPTSGIADNCNAGMGLLVYQAMCYKKANPHEEVYIDVSYYRFSIETAVNINRNSRYFGYMRQLGGKTNYDKYGFVRISYLLLCAAKMGINVTTIGHIDAYPMTAGTMGYYDYFTSQLNDPCDPDYVADGVVGDYLNFCQVDWTLQNKGGTDMMHTKMCAVSHYLDMNGVEHRNAVWSGSTNLDGINPSGKNANAKQQTATIVSGHADIYRTAVNYLRLIPKYQEQEEIYEFQDLVNQLSTKQGNLILEGRGDEIPSNEQIIYLGTENDSVFELYFTPLGGDILVWNETFNPYCKYMRKLYNSEDYIIFTWNAAEYNGGFPLGRQLEEMLIAAFHENRNVNNRIYGRMEHFDATSFDDLKVGVDIGYKSFNKLEFGEVHNKDVQFSYVENGQRYYVNLLNSMNMHSGSMYYQSNFALVIKETELTEDSVFFALADNTTNGIVEHSYTDEVLEYLPEDNKDGYTYHPCAHCDKKQILDTIHRSGDWIVVQEATKKHNGVSHRTCTDCGLLLEAREYLYPGDALEMDLSYATGKTFSEIKDDSNILNVSSTPMTIEATIQLSNTVTARGGIVLGNYNNSADDQLNLEIYTYGRPRLFISSGGQRTEHLFNTDIRSEKAVHLALTVEGRTVKLYVDGKLKETVTLGLDMPAITDKLWIGGDNRSGNYAFFKGSIYDVALFSDIRTEEELLKDAIAVFPDESDLLASKYYYSAREVSDGKTFTSYTIAQTHALSKTPLTLEAIIKVDKEFNERAGVVVGNYDGSNNQKINLEINKGGKVRLYLHNGTKATSYLFDTDIRSAEPVHIAVTLDDLTATLYVNGEAKSSVTMEYPAPAITGKLRIGGDYRTNNSQYFKGTIYAVHLFDHVRTSEQILNDMIQVSKNALGVLYTNQFGETNNINIAAALPVGRTFFAESSLTTEIPSTPMTLEAIVSIPSSYKERAGVIVGNYDNKAAPRMNLEIFDGGKVRLWMHNGTTSGYCLFDTDIRSDSPTHIAVTINGDTATLFVNGEATSTKDMPFAMPAISGKLKIGGDFREGNSQYFKGTIYAVHLFDQARTPEQIRSDSITVAGGTAGLMYSKYFVQNDTSKASVGKLFTDSTSILLETLADTPKTIEATIQLNKSYWDRGGVIVGNFDGLAHSQINFEIYCEGKPRIYVANDEGVSSKCTFDVDIRSNNAVHLAVTIDGFNATLYVNGKAVQTKTLTVVAGTSTEGYYIGGDRREGNVQYFKGSIYNVCLFNEVRTAEQIAEDGVNVSLDDSTLISYTDLTIPSSSYSKDSTAVAQKFKENAKLYTPQLSETPMTFEAILKVDPADNQRAGVVIGNYNGTKVDQLNLEIYANGRPRLFYVNGGTKSDVIFDTDIRSTSPVHMAITIEGLTASLYVNGKLVEQKTLPMPLPKVTNAMCVGGDYRTSNYSYFQGELYSVSLYNRARTAEQILSDSIITNASDLTLMYNALFVLDSCTQDSHTASDVIVDTEVGENTPGMSHIECTLCGEVLQAWKNKPVTEMVANRVYEGAQGFKPSVSQSGVAIEPLAGTPFTIEAVVQLNKSYSPRGGVIIGNYDGSEADQFNLEIYYNGNPRLYYKVNNTVYRYTFKTDIRSSSPVHLALTIDGLTAKLYINGTLKETIKLGAEIPQISEGFKIGCDNRADSPLWFAGTIYSVSLYESVRTEQQIAVDRYLPSQDSEGLLFDKFFSEAQYQNGVYDLTGMSIVNFGDSIFGNYKSPVDISTYLANNTKATTYNVGFGSAQMSENSTAKYEPFGMKNLADAITTGDWTTQDAVINSGNAPTAYKRCLPTLKSIDFNTVDIITIAYGTNDFKNGKSLNDVADALRYSIEKISAKYPSIEIVICTPVYRFWLDDDGNFIEDSNTKEINGIKLTDYIQLYKDVAKEYNLLVIDNYYGSGINESNRTECFTGTDSTHPNETGRQMIAANISKELIAYYNR